MSARFRVLAVSTVALACVAAFALWADVVVPSSAFSTGINAEFHSDVRIFNPTGSPVDFTPIFYRSDAGGNVINTVQMPVVTIGPRQQLSYDNVLQSLFGQSIGAFGPIRFQTAGALFVSSGVNNINGCGNGSKSGQGLPGIDVSQALKTGTLVQLAASGDPATGYRSNLDFMNPGTKAATVTATIRKGDGTHLSNGTFSVGPNGLVQKKIDDSGAFPGVAGTTDTNLWMEFTSDQPLLVFASVINNGSGDPFAVEMTADPTPAPIAPVASFAVSGTLMTGNSVTFTDNSKNAPTYRFWSFGDGTYASDSYASGSNTVQHMYVIAGVYHAALFVVNAGGENVMLTDVVVQDSNPYNPYP